MMHGYSPKFLMSGHELRAPIDLVHVIQIIPNTLTRRTSLEKFALACANHTHWPGNSWANIANETNTCTICAYAHPSSLSKLVVWFDNASRYIGRSSKCQRNYSEPLLVTNVLNPVTVVIQTSRWANPFVVHTDKLKI